MLLDFRFMMDEVVEGLMVFKLLDDGVLLCDRLLEVQSAALSDCVTLEITGDTDKVDTLELQIDETGSVDKMMLPVDDGILGILAMEDTGKLEKETLQPVAGVPGTEVMSEDGEVSEVDSLDRTILFLVLIPERTIFPEDVETVGRTMLLLEADGKVAASDDGRLKMRGNSWVPSPWQLSWDTTASGTTISGSTIGSGLV